MRIQSSLIYILLMTILISIIPANKAMAAPGVSANAAVLIEQESGRVIFGKHEHEKRRIASITKIMTAILAVESGKMDETVTVSKNAEGTEGSSLYLIAGEKIKLRDLVYGLMLRSGNDSAVAIAEHVGGSVEGFSYLMNQKAEEIGMKNTNFRNPHGLDTHEDHYSSAYDMAILTRYAMLNKEYEEIAGTKVHRAPHPEGKWDRVWKNKNKLVTGLYKYSTGGKTGYTKRAKRTLVSTASKDGMNLIAVTLNAPGDWNDHIAMFDYTFKNYELVKVLDKGVISKIKDPFYKNKVYYNHDFSYPVLKGEESKFKVKINLLTAKESWKSPEDIPVPVGKAFIYLGDSVIGEQSIFFETENMPPPKESFLDIFKNLFFTFMGLASHG
ncbi:D-alanyl-D-alanine carboxypeptidase family protein [Bacillus suaedaesalsae]|uniref:serine-type D-Ala-D-Ala carboxypeptidase n=1 Tax=Bacillus suaedaesalsae TaxID=2810349 RepID=A0ABS2DN35_9BACI|nr:D-alanyl-D-alanine carboxypeptidase family protein [Bacillus suaedaesalsae]MBM6619925.1 D-alanyl-D-alanine carboxypeptidase [Bacillus suaedaesalsae]